MDPREFSCFININTFYNTHTPNNIGAFVAHEDFVSSFPFVGTSVTPCDTAEIAVVAGCFRSNFCAPELHDGSHPVEFVPGY